MTSHTLSTTEFVASPTLAGDLQAVLVELLELQAQAKQAMANLAEALAAAGSGLAQVLKTTVYVASSDRADLVAAWDVISSAFGEHDVPSTLLGVAVLGYPGQLVEIEAVALAGS